MLKKVECTLPYPTLPSTHTQTEVSSLDGLIAAMDRHHREMKDCVDNLLFNSSTGGTTASPITPNNNNNHNANMNNSNSNGIVIPKLFNDDSNPLMKHQRVSRALSNTSSLPPSVAQELEHLSQKLLLITSKEFMSSLAPSLSPRTPNSKSKSRKSKRHLRHTRDSSHRGDNPPPLQQFSASDSATPRSITSGSTNTTTIPLKSGRGTNKTRKLQYSSSLPQDSSYSNGYGRQTKKKPAAMGRSVSTTRIIRAGSDSHGPPPHIMHRKQASAPRGMTWTDSNLSGRVRDAPRDAMSYSTTGRGAAITRPPNPLQMGQCFFCSVACGRPRSTSN